MDPRSDDPTTVGRHRVVARLADDELGRILVGVDGVGRRAALRLISPELAAEPGFVDRLHREVQTAALAPAWFAAPVLDADPFADPPWLISALVEGPTLQAYVSANGPLGEHGALALAVRMADGLVALHQAGVAHRDLIPANVVLAEDGPRLINLGVRRAADPIWRARTGHPLGGPGFLPPELVRGESDGDAAGDMFSFGAVVAYAATGQVPAVSTAGAGAPTVVAPTTELVPDRASTTAGMAAVEAGPDLGPLRGPFRDVVLACLAADPAARPSAHQVQDVLARLEASGAPTETVAPSQPATVAVPGVPAYADPAYGAPAYAPPAGPGTGRRRPWPAIVAAAAIGSVLAVAAVLVLGSGAGWFGGGQQTPVGQPTSAPPPPPPPGITKVVDVGTDDSYGAGTARFVTPSGNIACAVSGTEARCDVGQRTWTLPPTPADCAGEFGTGAVLTGSEPGRLSCVSDTLANPSLKELAYGTAVRLGTVVCASRENGVRCEDDRTGHGFQVARAAYELF
jgi:hypothetical protein